MNATDLMGQYSALLVWAPLVIAGLGAFTAIGMARSRRDARAGEQKRQEEQEQKARILALFDEHTMMRNRASFQQEVVAWIQRCEQTGQSFDLFHGALKFSGPASVEHIEFAMRDIAERVQPRLRDSDILARFSHSDFIVLRMREHGADLPQRLHEQLHVLCSQPIKHRDGLILPIAHLGSAQFPNDARHSRTLIQVAQRQAAMLVMPVPLQRVA